MKPQPGKDDLSPARMKNDKRKKPATIAGTFYSVRIGGMQILVRPRGIEPLLSP